MPAPTSASPMTAYQNHFLRRFFSKVFVISHIRNEPNQRNNGNRIIHKAWGYHLITTRIRMQANQIEIDPKIGHNDTCKSNDGHEVKQPFASHTRDQSHV